MANSPQPSNTRVHFDVAIFSAHCVFSFISLHTRVDRDRFVHVTHTTTAMLYFFICMGIINVYGVPMSARERENVGYVLCYL